MSMVKQYGKKRQLKEQNDTRDLKRHQLDNRQNLSSANLQKCSICKRNFTQDRLIEHEHACKKSKSLQLNSRHNYHYNSQLHRWKGLDYRLNTNRSSVKSLARHSSKTHWREKHQQFQNAIKGEYNSTNNDIQSLDDRPYQCSRCQRKFTTENAITKHQKGCTTTRRIGIKSTRHKNVHY